MAKNADGTDFDGLDLVAAIDKYEAEHKVDYKTHYLTVNTQTGEVQIHKREN